MTQAEQVAAWMYPAEQRIRGIGLGAELRNRPRRRAPLEFVGPMVGPGEHALVDAIASKPFLGDTIRVAGDVANAFQLDSITVGNLAQTRNATLPATSCSPASPLRLLDWCPARGLVRIRVTNISTKRMAFRCVLEGDQVEAAE
jgi:hypothetical protein